MEVVGICKLCMRQRKLCDSDLLPKAGYRLVAKSQDGEAPIVMKPHVSISKDEHVRGHVFCEDCEELFSRNGEAWVLKNCWRPNEGFALKSALDNAKPLYERGKWLRVYSAANIAQIDVHRLVY